MTTGRGVHVTGCAADRSAAAGLLRAARDGGDDEIDWAFSVLPDSLPTRRLKVEHLIRAGDLEGADALIAQGLRRHPTHAGLTLLRARVLFARGRAEAARRELRLVLAARPRHRGALVLAGRVALRLGDPRAAAEYFERAERRRPDDPVRTLVADAWLAVGRPRMARDAMRRMDASPPALLRSRILRSEGRLLEAVELLEETRRDGEHTDPQAVLCALIDVLEETGDLQRLRRVLAPVTADDPAVLARAGMAWLAMGAFQAAVVAMARLARVTGYRAQALAIMMVAATFVGRGSLAERALQRLRRIDEPIDRETVAEAWSRGLLGRLMLDQCSPRRAGTDPHTGLLERLLQDAAAVFRRDLAAAETLSRAERLEIEHLLRVCRQAAPEPAADEDATPAPAALLSQ